MIKQNIVFVENKAGSLKRVTGIIADNGINIYGFACFDASSSRRHIRPSSRIRWRISLAVRWTYLKSWQPS